MRQAASAHDGRRRAPRYTRIYLDARRALGLSITEYALADIVFVLSRRSGWCYASHAYVAELLGVSERSVRRMVARLKERGLLESHPSKRGHIRPTSRWISAIRTAQDGSTV